MKKNNIGVGQVPAHKSNQGITLIALIITIIILLILATITVDVAIDDGLFTKAQEAVDKTNDKVENTQNRVDELTGILEDLEEKPKIGDYVNYEPEIDTYKVTTDESGHSEVQNFETQTGENSLRWRIMSLGDKNGNILLVADRPTEDELTLYDGAGYTYATTHIEGICSELYDNETLGITARSYNCFNTIYHPVEDIDKALVGGDEFPYLTGDQFWIPGTYQDSFSSTELLFVFICDAQGKASSVSMDNDEVGYPLLPVIIIPANYELIYSRNDSNWNVWNLQAIE